VAQIGLVFDLRNPPQWRRPWADHYANVLELIEGGERLGAASVWLSEHHFFEDGYLPQPLTFAAAVAARTKRVRIGTAVMKASNRSAVQFAEEAAIVDILSGGRLELGIGAGYRLPEFEAFGADPNVRFKVVSRLVRDLRRIWSEGKVTPAPIQNPIPLWMGFNGPVGARRAGRLGEGLLSILPGQFEAYCQGLDDAGIDRSVARVSGLVHMMLADDPEAAWPRIAPHVAYQWDTYGKYGVEGTGKPIPPPLKHDDLRQSRRPGFPPLFSLLTPDQAAQNLKERLAGQPVRHLFLWGTVAGMPDDLAQRNVELISTKLVPALATLGSGSETVASAARG
jgi:alkanesulfonate monooxygenase SsuD/methylene tetrahydromethanopterin reductase-like flavin-dependent oxidoreductase (luciferase family)